jgi:lambda repressor-like predicted transcriptional regulator
LTLAHRGVEHASSLTRLDPLRSKNVLNAKCPIYQKLICLLLKITFLVFWQHRFSSYSMIAWASMICAITWHIIESHAHTCIMHTHQRTFTVCNLSQTNLSQDEPNNYNLQHVCAHCRICIHTHGSEFAYLLLIAEFAVLDFRTALH